MGRLSDDSQPAGTGTYSSYVVHGATAGTSRPTSTGPVLWIGSVTPTNATAGDEWRDTTTDPYTVKIKGASSFTTVGGTSVALTPTTKTTAYTAAVNDLVLADTTSAGFTVTLPTAPATGALVGVKKISGDTNTLTIAAAGGGTIDGSATATTVTQWAGVELQHVGSNVWRVVASMSTTGPAGTNGTNGVNAALSIIQDEGVALTQRDTINFTGSGVTASDAGGKTVVNIPGGGSSATGLIPRKHLSGRYVTTPGVNASLTMSSGYLRAFPFEVYASTSFSAMGINIQTAQTGGSIRLGVYTDNAGVPDALVFEATTTTQIDAATTGNKEVATTQTLAPGVYWLAARATGGAGATPQAMQYLPVIISSATQAGVMTNNPCGYEDNGSGSGALPASWGATYNQVTIVPKIVLKTA